MNDAPSVACSNCSVSNPVGAKFCSACAKPLAPGAMPPPPQPQYQPSPHYQMPIGGSGFLGGKEEMRKVYGTPDSVFERILDTIQASGGEIREQHRGQMISAIMIEKGFWSTGGMTYKFPTDVTLEALGADQTVVRIKGNVDYMSTLGGLLPLPLLAIFGAQYNLTIAAFFWPLMFLSVGYWFWSINSLRNKITVEKILSKLNVSVIGQPTPPHAQPSPPPSPSAKPQPPGAAEDTEGNIIKKIQKLAELRDAGAITADEFEGKKAELLSRI